MRRLLTAVALLALAVPAAASTQQRAPFEKVFVPGTVRVQFFPWATPEQVQEVLADHHLVPLSGPSGGVVVARTALDAWSVASRLNRSPFVDWAVPHYVLRPARPVPVVPIRPLPGRP